MHFADIGADYFARDDPPSPVQHFWSLAVEEQFYLVWPVVLAAALLLVTRPALCRASAMRIGSRAARLAPVVGLCVARLVRLVVRKTSRRPHDRLLLDRRPGMGARRRRADRGLRR